MQKFMQANPLAEKDVADAFQAFTAFYGPNGSEPIEALYAVDAHEFRRAMYVAGCWHRTWAKGDDLQKAEVRAHKAMRDFFLLALDLPAIGSLVDGAARYSRADEGQYFMPKKAVAELRRYLRRCRDPTIDGRGRKRKATEADSPASSPLAGTRPPPTKRNAKRRRKVEPKPSALVVDLVNEDDVPLCVHSPETQTQVHARDHDHDRNTTDGDDHLAHQNGREKQADAEYKRLRVRTPEARLSSRNPLDLLGGDADGFNERTLSGLRRIPLSDEGAAEVLMAMIREKRLFVMDREDGIACEADAVVGYSEGGRLGLLIAYDC